ncbi:unnamed protein product [Adineta steineri]|uniref:Uncharacterized protein n=2 Tax=Adineta steineri TaxID=433720 RepID=A0A818RM32_9BILA|nr:unnamed protein product [Adineta steineri]
MISKKVYLVFQLLFLIYLFHISNGLECKVCQKNDPNCSLGENIKTRKCENDNDYCFSWFDRKGSVVGTERGCMSSDTPEYEAIKEIIGNKNNGCVKSVNSLDCFKFCSVDNYNGLDCKVCQKNDPNCLLGENVETRKCENDNDYCFSWFDRKGSVVGTERDCMSSDTPEYEAIKEMIGNKNNGCVKSVKSLDCFTFCSVDKCN